MAIETAVETAIEEIVLKLPEADDSGVRLAQEKLQLLSQLVTPKILQTQIAA
jgi:hypothetical protein